MRRALVGGGRPHSDAQRPVTLRTGWCRTWCGGWGLSCLIQSLWKERLWHYSTTGSRPRGTTAPALAAALAAAAASITRLDEALVFHPLQRAFLFGARLEAVRRQAAVDGQLIDPLQLAAVLEGLRLRMDGALPIIERLETLDAARHALAPHQWLVAPDFDEEGEVRRIGPEPAERTKILPSAV